MTLGQRIHALRSAAGLSQEQLAERLNVSRQAISKWELDTSAPDLDKLVLLGNLFGISLDQLVKGDTAGLPPGELDVRQLAVETQRRQQMTVLAVIGSLSTVLGAVSFAFLYALRGEASSIKYMLYRYIAVGEYVYAPASYQLPLLLSAGILVIGVVVLLIFLRETSRKL